MKTETSNKNKTKLYLHFQSACVIHSCIKNWNTPDIQFVPGLIHIMCTCVTWSHPIKSSGRSLIHVRHHPVRATKKQCCMPLLLKSFWFVTETWGYMNGVSVKLEHDLWWHSHSLPILWMKFPEIFEFRLEVTSNDAYDTPFYVSEHGTRSGKSGNYHYSPNYLWLGLSYFCSSFSKNESLADLNLCRGILLRSLRVLAEGSFSLADWIRT